MFIIITYIIITADEESIEIYVHVGGCWYLIHLRYGSIMLVWRLGAVEWGWFALVAAIFIGICDILIGFISVFGEVSAAFVEVKGLGKSGLGIRRSL